MSDLQSILDRRAAATPGPQFVDVIDEHTGLPGGRTWLICDLARSGKGNNSVSFGEDEATARFVAASFTDVPALAGRLQKAEQILATMENLLDRNAVIPGDYSLVAEDLREALGLEPR